MSASSAAIHVNVDVTNPGQFFACCGLLELASRLSSEAQGWFEADHFHISEGPSLVDLIAAVTTAKLTQIDPEDVTASPILIEIPFALRLDWWKSGDRTTSDLKVWAGRMESFRIARAMQQTMKAPAFSSENLLNCGMVAYEADDPEKKVEPFYFDARRGPNAHSRDIGFSPNDLGLTTIASPAVELLCLIGLQRVRPVSAGKPRLFDYYIWTQPLPVALAPVAAAGLLGSSAVWGYRFESWFRTGQRKHKAFLTAKPISNHHE
jgi:CRISPR-associated protein Csb3